MGYGSYSVAAAVNRSAEKGYKTMSAASVFTARKIESAMSPMNLEFRESRDSAEHPNSVPIIVGLDVTGSMGSIPHYLISTSLPKIMGKIMQAGEADPQMLFVAVGDHECDNSPLQVAQFESSDELLDKWLKQVYLEGGGGGNAGESYHLAWYLAANHTKTDSFEKRGKKGLLFTIGDEPVLADLSSAAIRKITGNGDSKGQSAAQLLEQAEQTFDVYHIHVKFTRSGGLKTVQDGWKQLMGDNVLFADDQDSIATLIAETVIKHKDNTTVKVKTSSPAPTGEKDEEML